MTYHPGLGLSIKTEGEDSTREGADGSDELDEVTIAAITLTELTNSCKTDLRREQSRPRAHRRMRPNDLCHQKLNKIDTRDLRIII